MSRRPKAIVALIGVLAALGAAGCGDDDEPTTGGAGESTSTAAETTATETIEATETSTDQDTGTTTETTTGEDDTPETSPEDRPGGAGDEVPASSQALITGRDGRLTPKLVRVPPFIAIRVELHAADSGSYELEARGRRIAVGGGVDSKSSMFAGLRPGDRLVLTGPQGRVVVEASAEPGP